MIAIITEKPGVAQDIAKVLGVTLDNLDHPHPISGIKIDSFRLYLSVKSLPICLIPTQKVS